MKDKVASILGESKSTYASSMNKVSSSNIEESASDNKPRFYRRELNSSETDLQAAQIQDKRIGNNFRIVRSPGEQTPSHLHNIVRVGDPMKNSFVTNQAVNKPKKSNSNISNVPNMGLTSNIQSRNVGMRRKSRLQFKRVPSETTGETEQIIHEKYGSKTSSNLGQIKEENRENNSQATIRNDSRDPRQKSTPRVEEHKGDQEIDIYHETHEGEEFSKIFV